MKNLGHAPRTMRHQRIRTDGPMNLCTLVGLIVSNDRRGNTVDERFGVVEVLEDARAGVELAPGCMI